MSGPIVRTGTNPQYWDNYDKIFRKGQADAKPAAEPTLPVAEDVSAAKKKSSKKK